MLIKKLQEVKMREAKSKLLESRIKELIHISDYCNLDHNTNIKIR